MICPTQKNIMNRGVTRERRMYRLFERKIRRQFSSAGSRGCRIIQLERTHNTENCGVVYPCRQVAVGNFFGTCDGSMRTMLGLSLCCWSSGVTGDFLILPIFSSEKVYGSLKSICLLTWRLSLSLYSFPADEFDFFCVPLIFMRSEFIWQFFTLHISPLQRFFILLDSEMALRVWQSEKMFEPDRINLRDEHEIKPVGDSHVNESSGQPLDG